MAICGYAVQPGGQPLLAHEFEAMRASFGHEAGRAESCATPLAGLASIRSSPAASLWSDNRFSIVCEGDFYRQGPATEPPIQQSIAELYVAEGPVFPHQLRGAFSIALWDHEKQTLLLAVDRFGVKPLCYALLNSGILFASQPRGVFASGRFAKDIDLTAITDYFVYNVVPIPKTAFHGISRVRPGECVTWNVKGINARSYWQMRYPEDASGAMNGLSRQLYARMEECVRVTSADLDLDKAGCFLSGGTDSSSVLGLVTKLHRRQVRAFSIGFSEERFNELEYAKLAARHFSAQHVEGLLGPDEAFEAIPKIVAAFDEPFANSSAIPTYICAKLARECGVDVLLAGDGGDELFGGNERYRKNEIFRAYQRIPLMLRRSFIEPTVRIGATNGGLLGKAQNYIRQANMPHPERYCQWRLLRKFSPETVLGSGMPFRNGHSDLLATIRAHYNNAPAHSELNRLLYVDVKMTLGDDDLPKVTRTAELAGISVRFPYLDHELAEFTGRLPAKMKVNNLEKRCLFKMATWQLLPEAILKKKKHGFGLPIGFWLDKNPRLHSWAKEVLFDPKTYQRGYFRRDFVAGLFVKMSQDDTPYFGDLLWTFLMLELWHRQHVEARSC
jgi:asparagine synthase (glutamine-hydrolysing)